MWARVSTLSTKVGRLPTPRSDGRGGVIIGVVDALPRDAGQGLGRAHGLLAEDRPVVGRRDQAERHRHGGQQNGDQGEDRPHNPCGHQPSPSRNP
jgi:hypothetical protein